MGRASSRMKKIYKLQIAKMIYKQLYGEIPLLTILDVISVICDELINYMLSDRSLSIDNFGTFQPSIYISRDSHDLKTDKILHRTPSRIIKFIPHINFISLIKQRIDIFKEVKDERST